MPHRCPITNGTARVPPVFVQAFHCQCAQMFLSLFHSYGAAGATPLPHRDIHLLPHRSGTTAVDHFQYPLKCYPKDHLSAHNYVWAQPMPIPDAFSVIFLNGYITEMTEKMEKRT